MKRLFLLQSIAAVLIITGCKKDTAATLSLPEVNTIKQTLSNGSAYNYIETFIYDQTNKLKEVKISGSNATPNAVKRYNYQGNQAEYRYFVDGFEQPSSTVIYTLNNLEKVTQRFAPYFNSRSMYEYDAAGFTTRINYVSNGLPGGHVLYGYSGDHVLDSIAIYESNGTAAYVDVYSYNANTKNTIGNTNKGLSFLEKDQHQLLKKETRYVYNLGNAPGVRIRYFENDYNYTYDTAGNVKTVTVTRIQFPYPTGNVTFFVLGVYEYTYR